MVPILDHYYTICIIVVGMCLSFFIGENNEWTKQAVEALGCLMAVVKI